MARTVSIVVGVTDERRQVLPLDRIILSLVDRLLNVGKEIPRGESLRGEFDDQLFVARAATSNRRRIWFNEESALGDFTRLLLGIYLTCSVVLVIAILLILPETHTPGSRAWAALAAILVSPMLGQVFWHGIVNEVRFHSSDVEWGGVITIAPVVVICLDIILGVIAWSLFR